MSLPKEPRQKMINIMYLVLTALLALNVSSEILNAFKTVNNSLEKTNTAVNRSSGDIFKSLTDKMSDPTTQAKAMLWQPRAKQAMDNSATAYNFIQGLKDDIIKAAGGTPGDTTDKYKEDNLDIATRMMIKQGKGKQLYDLLAKYKTDILAINDTIKAEFTKNPLQVDLTMPKTQNKSNKTWAEAYFHMVPTVAALTILSKFQNDIKTSENRVVTFCHEQVGKVELRFDRFEAIVGQNSKYLMPGQDIEITAGLGAFSSTKIPQVSFGGSGATKVENGVSYFTGSAGGMGPHTINVIVSFKDQDGADQTKTFPVEYIVGSSNTSIALDEMNVLYIGYDNKVTVAASGAGDDRVSVSISGGGGSIVKQGGGHYIAKVNTVDDNTVINVSVDGKVLGSQQFRVRTIPDPVATVGGVMSNENMPAGQFRAQTGVGAYIKDFPLKLQYTVVSFTLTADDADGNIEEAPCQGNTWSPKALSMIKGLAGGRTVTLDNIRAQGPDGRVRKIPGLTYYIK